MMSDRASPRLPALIVLSVPPPPTPPLKARCHRVFMERARLVHCEARVQKLLGGVDGATARFDWLKAGPYELVWKQTEGGKDILSHVRHVSGAEAQVPDCMIVDKSWDLVEPIHEQLTRLEKLPCASLKLASLFNEGVGPNMLANKKKAPNCLTTLAAKIKAQEDMGKAGLNIAHESFLEESKKAKSEIMAQRMKERMSKHQEVVKRQKMITLSGA